MVDAQRSVYWEKFSAAFTRVSVFLSDLQEVKCEYFRGWDSNRDLTDVHEDRLDSDLFRGYTQSGFHRPEPGRDKHRRTFNVKN